MWKVHSRIRENGRTTKVCALGRKRVSLVVTIAWDVFSVFQVFRRSRLFRTTVSLVLGGRRLSAVVVGHTIWYNFLPFYSLVPSRTIGCVCAVGSIWAVQADFDSAVV